MPTRKHFLFCLISLALTGSLAHAGVITLDADLQGWYESNGTTNGASNVNNYLAGTCCGSEYRNWFQFSIPVISGGISSARLLINAVDVSTQDPSETYQVTSIPNAPAFGDLGTGSVYGSRVFTPADSYTTVAIPRALLA
jgi:hypothetical protein